MFFYKELEHTILLHPSFFGPQMQEYLRRKLYDDVQGTCSGRYGYIICVVDVLDIGKGYVTPGSGLAEFNIKYRAIVFKPFKGEVVDATVTLVNKMGFFAEVGPLQIFVSGHLIPPEMRFDPNSNPPCWVSHEASLRKDDRVRLKIVGTRLESTEIFAIGTLKEDYLGVL